MRTKNRSRRPQAGTGEGALGNERRHAKGACVKFSSINVHYIVPSFPPKKPSVLVGPGVEFTWRMCQESESSQGHVGRGPRTEIAHRVPFIQNRSCAGGRRWGRGATLGLDRKQWSKRMGRVAACLCLGSMFLKGSERPAGQMLLSRAERGAAELRPALEKSGTPASVRKFVHMCEGVSAAGPKGRAPGPCFPSSAVSSTDPPLASQITCADGFVNCKPTVAFYC